MSQTATQGDTSLQDRVIKRIKVLLLLRDMSQTELAGRVGIKQPYLSRRMTGEVSLNLDEIEAIAVVLGVDALDLMRPPESLPPIDVEAKPRIITRGGERRQRSGRSSYYGPATDRMSGGGPVTRNAKRAHKRVTQPRDRHDAPSTGGHATTPPAPTVPPGGGVVRTRRVDRPATQRQAVTS
jgi:transcriptional regulator with XRE-family HTH domain